MVSRLRKLHELLIVAGILLFGIATLRAESSENRFTVDAWGTEQGLLPQSSVLAIAHTHDGYLWLGT
ncbi:MAG TPA: two-component regulator propeller domain-containing protein, partial [Verrucomicrobiae bacterium]